MNRTTLTVTVRPEVLADLALPDDPLDLDELVVRRLLANPDLFWEAQRRAMGDGPAGDDVPFRTAEAT